jgi:hypothetical protein
VALQPSAGYGLLWLCSPAWSMASCGSVAQRGLWPPVVLQPSAGYGLLVSRGFVTTHNDVPQSVGLLWTSDQLLAETYTSQHTQHPCPRCVLCLLAAPGLKWNIPVQVQPSNVTRTQYTKCRLCSAS